MPPKYEYKTELMPSNDDPSEVVVSINSDEFSQLLEETPVVSTVESLEGWALEDTDPRTTVSQVPLDSKYEMLWIVEDVGYCDCKRFHLLTGIQKRVCLSILIAHVILIVYAPVWVLIPFDVIGMLLLLYSRRTESNFT